MTKINIDIELNYFINVMINGVHNFIHYYHLEVNDFPSTSFIIEN